MFTMIIYMPKEKSVDIDDSSFNPCLPWGPGPPFAPGAPDGPDAKPG